MSTLNLPKRVLGFAATFPLALLGWGAAAPPAQAIVGGQTAKRIQPYDGSLQRIDSPRRDYHVCGATLIAPRWAITAGHCTGLADTKTSLAGTGKTKIVLSGNPFGWKVRFGSRRVAAGGRVVPVVQFVRLSRSVDPQGDIALLKLGRPAGVTPARVLTRTPAPGTRVRIQGWGYTGLGGLRDYQTPRSYPKVLRAAVTKLSAMKVCGLKPAQKALCVGVGERPGPDNMDSGGPVFVDEPGRGPVLAGTVNGGNYRSGLRPSVYTDLSTHRAWIDSYTSARRTIPAPAPVTAPGIAGAATIATSGCSASVVRVAESQPTDPAMVLTNGHCVTPRPNPGEAYVDRAADDLVVLLGKTSNPVARATATHLLYATMTGTDVALYRLRESYAQLTAAGVPARLLATAGPKPGDALTMFAGAYQTTYACTAEAVVPAVREAGYTQLGSVRYATSASCQPRPGTSGSPLIDARTGQLVAIHNSHVDGEDEPCSENNPCEVAPDGTSTSVKGRGYAQQVARLTPCLAAGSVFDPGRLGCTLPKGL